MTCPLKCPHCNQTPIEDTISPRSKYYCYCNKNAFFDHSFLCYCDQSGKTISYFIYHDKLIFSYTEDMGFRLLVKDKYIGSKLILESQSDSFVQPEQGLQMLKRYLKLLAFL